MVRSMSDPILQIEDLSVGYDGVPLGSGITFSVRPGELAALIGPNGAGKTTIIRTAANQIRPISGRILLDGRDISQMNGREIAKIMSLVMTTRLDPELMTCEDIVNTGRHPYTGILGILSDEDRGIVKESMELVNVYDLKDRLFSRISDGQRQRVMLARALAQQPRLLIMDEPTSFLDIKYKLELMRLVRGIVEERGLAVLISMHEIDLACKTADTIICIKDACVDRIGTPAEIFNAEYISHLYDITVDGYNWLYGNDEKEDSGHE